MFDKVELRKLAIESCERELKSLNDFAENEGHSNVDVMLAISIRICDVEKQIEELKNFKPMTISDRIERWLDEQIEVGKTRDEIHGTHFSYGNKIAVIKKSGKAGYKLDFYLEPKAVFFK